MAVWADNIKFVREIIESKFSKIDISIAEVRLQMDRSIQRININICCQINEGVEMLENDPTSSHGKEHLTFALRNLELVQPTEIEMLLETIVGVSLSYHQYHGKKAGAGSSREREEGY